MKYIIITISILAISCSALDPCQNKDLFLKEHKAFVEETIKKSKDYSDEDWDIRNEEFEKLANECYKNVEESMSKDEKKEFWINSSEYLAERMKTDGKQDFENLKDLLSGLTENGSDVVDGLANAFGDDLESTFEEFGDDLNEVFDDEFEQKMKDIFDEDFKEDLKGALEKLGKSLESMADEFKDILEEKNN
jgi:hypothetical protein